MYMENKYGRRAPEPRFLPKSMYLYTSTAPLKMSNLILEYNIN